MKIGLVCPHDLRVPGGVQEHIKALAVEFEGRGHRVTVIAPGTGGVEREGNRMFLGGAIRFPTPNKSWSQISLMVETPERRLKEIVDQERFDILHFHSPVAPFLSRQILQVSSAINVATFHSEWGETMDPLVVDSLQFILRPFALRMKDKLHGLIAVSRVARSSWEEIFDGSLPEEIIPNGVDLNRFRPENEARRVFGNRPTILFVGRVEPRKGLKYLLRAFCDLQARMEKVRLVVVAGPLLVKFKMWVRSEGLSDKVFFAGRVSDEELPGYYAGADLFCSPATGGESFGIVLLEALASGDPLVVFDNPGYLELLEDCPAEEVFVPARDVGSLTDRLELFLENKELRERVVKWGLDKVEDYSWPRVAERVLDFYRRLE